MVSRNIRIVKIEIVILYNVFILLFDNFNRNYVLIHPGLYMKFAGIFFFLEYQIEFFIAFWIVLLAWVFLFLFNLWYELKTYTGSTGITDKKALEWSFPVRFSPQWFCQSASSLNLQFVEIKVELEPSEPKWVNPSYILWGVNSLRFGGL